jgi:hypothetical protein
MVQPNSFGKTIFGKYLQQVRTLCVMADIDSIDTTTSYDLSHHKTFFYSSYSFHIDLIS